MTAYPIALAPRRACDYDMMTGITTKRDSILDILRRATDSLLLQQANMELAMLHTSRDWRTCKSYLDRFFVTSTASNSSSIGAIDEQFLNQIVCTQEYTNDLNGNFFYDTCCYSDPSSCCPGTDLNQSVETYTFNTSSSSYV
jgi:hypothetical protein